MARVTRGMYRALVRRALAYPASPALHREGQAVPAGEDLDDEELPAAMMAAAARPVAFSTVILTTTRTAPGRSGSGSLPSYFQDSCVSTLRPMSGDIDTGPRSST